MKFTTSYKIQKFFNRVHLYSIPFLKFIGVVCVLAFGLALLKHDLAGWPKYILAILALALICVGAVIIGVFFFALNVLYSFLLGKIEKIVSQKKNGGLSESGTFILHIVFYLSGLVLFTIVVIILYQFETKGWVEFVRGFFVVVNAYMAFISFGLGLKNLIELIKFYLS